MSANLYKRLFHKLILDDAINSFLTARKAERLSENTIDSYRNGLSKFRAFLGADQLVSDIQASDIRDFLAEQDHVSASTCLKYYTALASMWSWLVETGQAREHIVRQVRQPKAEEKEIIPLEKDQIVALLLAADLSLPYRTRTGKTTRHATQASARDRALIYVLLDTGIRASELCALRVSDIDGLSLRIRNGKGGKGRTVPISETTAAFLGAYLDNRPNPNPEDRIFPFKRRALGHCLGRLAARAKIPDVYPHRFRHTFAINYLRNGGDVYTLQKILGHTTLDMVKTYLHIAQTDVARMHIRASPVTGWGI